jgi:SAM-dependent methyltransferase
MPEEFSYDAVPYPSKYFLQTHPDRLASIAALYGMETAPVEKCRVLELGCGNGSSLIAQAFSLPGCEFVGVDLGAAHIEEANRSTAELGLLNIVFHRADVMDMSAADYGAFDYITAHGLIAWVPEPVRERVVSIFREMLAPNGVGYLSYNAYPGSHIREMARGIMLWRSRDMDEPRAMVNDAISFLKFLADNAVEPKIYQMMVQTEFERHLKHSIPDVLHDEFAPVYNPYYFYQFVELLERHGLQYLAEADTYAQSVEGLSQDARQFLESMSDVVEREQYYDMFRGRSFRQTLFCREQIKIDRNIEPSIVDRFFVSSSIRPPSADIDLGPGKIVKFAKKGGRGLDIDHPLTKAALLILGDAWGDSISVPDLADQAERKLKENGIELADRARDRDILRTILLHILRETDLIELHIYRPIASTVYGIKPKVNRLTRWQLRSGNFVRTLLNKDLRIEDEISRELLVLLDGRRTKSEALSDLRVFIENNPQIEGKEELLDGLENWLDTALDEVARLGIFES